ncbi:membrane protein [Arthrobacter phage Racecar]|nr:hypothetical protein PBI_RACECAR_6 [Arthrobacter phage Racecar]QFG12691.1 hypothetical protein PBI_MIMI_6 [Arthrobacter phage Mimi]
MSIIGSIIALVVGILLLAWTTHIVLAILGWALIIAGAAYLVKNLLDNRNRTDL